MQLNLWWPLRSWAAKTSTPQGHNIFLLITAHSFTLEFLMPAEDYRAVTVEELSRCQGKERTVYVLLSWNGGEQGERLGNDSKEYISINFSRESADCSHNKYLQYFEKMSKTQLIAEFSGLFVHFAEVCRVRTTFFLNWRKLLPFKLAGKAIT